MLHATCRSLQFAGLLAGLLLINQIPHAAEPDAKDKAKPNRLAKESSPYLLQHAHNPVDWYPWGPEAFEKAKKEKKIIFLSIGYSSCHWCHVMEKESFSNQEVADLLNKNFVCIKVDREERPDIDDIYMNALHVMGSRGGWPLSMFLTPDGKPIVGGTYWPREDREIDGKSVNGYKSILKMVLKFWTEQPKQIEEQAELIAKTTAQAFDRSLLANPIVELDRALAKGAAQALADELDPVHGGLGRKANDFKGTKFPTTASIAALLDQAVRAKDEDLRKLIVLTLDRMAMGGIYDQVGGGFHRYSTERTWTVPHFEKMLYDNAQLVELYAEGFKLWKDPVYAGVIRETLAFVKRELTAPDGGFYSALDADSNGVEGEFYVWTPEEIEKALGDKADATFIRDVYGLGGKPNFEDKFYILRLQKPFAEVAKDLMMTVAELSAKLAPLKTKLLDYRSKRVRPFLDTKILTAWNGQMIAAYAKAGQILNEPEFIKTAARAADFILKTMRGKDGRLLRTYGKNAEGKWEAKLNGYLDDYAFVVHGLLNLYDATGEQKWLDEAKALTDLAVKWHGDGDKGGYFFTSSDHEKLFARPKEYADNAQPSANGVAARNLVRLWQATKDDQYRKLAEKTFRQFAGVMRSTPSNVPTMCFALNLYLDRQSVKPESKAITGKEITSDVVKIAAAAAAENGKRTVTVTVNIAAPWHIYANPSGNKTFTNPTTLTIRSDGKAIPAQVVYPEGLKVEDKDFGAYQIYNKSVVLTATLTGEKVEGPLEVSVDVQACSDFPDERCLKPTTLKTVVK